MTWAVEEAKVEIAVKEHVGEWAITLDEGDRVYRLIHPELTAGRPVALDFAGVRAVAAPFLNAAIGRLLQDIALDDLGRLLRMVHLQPAARAALDQVLRTAREFHEDASVREALACILVEVAMSR